MSQRQRKRRAWAKQKAATVGRAWQTGPSHALAVRQNRLAEHGHGGYTLPDPSQMAQRDERSYAGATRAARQSAIGQPVRIVDTPVPSVGTFRLRDI